MPNEPIAKIWKEELQNVIVSGNTRCESQTVELDAIAFTMFYLERYESIKVRCRIDGLDNVIDKYIIVNSHLF